MTTSPAAPTLPEGTVVLVRPGNRVHVGTDPHRGLMVEMDPSIPATRVADLLRSLTRPRSAREVGAELRCLGLNVEDLDTIMSGLADRVGSSRGDGHTRRTPPLRVHVHGRGPLASALLSSLAGAGIPTGHSVHRPGPGRSVRDWDANLVVLSDYLVHEPWLVASLMRHRIAHVQVRVRDGVGVVGPLVLPGLSSCLECADRYRAALEPAWPLLAAQLVRISGRASTGIVRATASLAHDQIDQLRGTLTEHAEILLSDVSSAEVAGPESTAPYLANRAIELYGSPPRIEVKTWSPHPLCSCRQPAPDGAGRVARGPATPCPLS